MALGSGMRAESRTSAFASNSLSSLLLQVVNLVVGFAVPYVIIGTYGSEVNGLVASLTQLVVYAQLVEAGISSAAVFQLYRPLAQGDMKGVNEIVSASKRFYYKSGALFLALVLALGVVYPLLVTIECLDPLSVVILVIALGATGALDFFMLAKYRVLLTAMQRNWIIQLCSVAYKVLYAIAITWGASMGISVAALFVLAILPAFVRPLILIPYTKKKYPQVDFSTQADDVTLSQRWDAFYLQVLGAVQGGAPVIIASFVLRDFTLVSIFSIYMLIANGLQNAINSFSQGTQASFGDVIVRGEAETLRRSFREFQVLAYALSGLLCGVAFALINPFVKLYACGVTDVEYVYPIVGFLSVLNVLIYHLKTPQGLLVIAAGLYRDTRFQTSLQTIILLVCSVVFGLVWGMPGVLLGMCLSNVYRVVDLLFYVPRKVTGTAPSETLRFMLMSVVVFAATIVPYAFVSCSCDTWLQWAANGILLLLWGVACAATVCSLFAKEQVCGLLLRARLLLRR